MAERYISAARDNFVDILREANRRELNTGDEDGMTPTHWAARAGNLAALRIIVARGGSVDKADYLGMTALHHGAERGDLSIVSFLVEFGCNVYSLDNEGHSAIDLAGLHNRTEIVRYLDHEIARRQMKNPKDSESQKIKALRKAEKNLKQYEKMVEAAAKKRDKEQKKRNKELEKGFPSIEETKNVDSGANEKMSFLKTLTMRGKNTVKAKNGPGTAGWVSASSHTLSSGTAKYSDLTGTATVSSRKGGIASKIQKKQTEASLRAGGWAARDAGHKSVRSVSSDQGFVRPSSNIMYVGSVYGLNGSGDGKRQSLSPDFFQKSKVYKSRSEADLLDSGIDSFNGDVDDNNDEEDEDAPGIFNRPEFGKMAFLQKHNFLNTLQSLDDEKSAQSRHKALLGDRRLSGDGEEGDRPSLHSDTSASKNSSLGSRDSQPPSSQSVFNTSSQLPWDLEDLGNIDDDDDEDDDETSKELSALYMFLSSCDLARLMPTFTREKVDLSLLMRMTDAEMKELGLEFGPRKRLREAVAMRQAALEAPPPVLESTYL
ncbi:hypothetical protein EGW08_020019 [Elysia chlorotica]|uniref:SAM domain-containing protein n=1 Tax=Elysia chlorotica TaxID=188477 RepID=A0A433SSI0_ELYCH|nr:hypothetical protein EGW08_020019 [Elysia chlorotica]